MIPPLSTVSEKSENLEYSAMGSALSRSMRSRHVSQGDIKNSYSKMGIGSGEYAILHNNGTMLSVDQTVDANVPNNIVDLNYWQNPRADGAVHNRSEHQLSSAHGSSNPERGAHRSMLCKTSPFVGANHR